MAATVARRSRVTGTLGHGVVGARRMRVGAVALALALTGCSAALEGEPHAGSGADHSPTEPPGGARRSRARASAGSLTMLSEVVGHGAKVDTATCLALDVNLEVADDHSPVPSPSEDGPLVVARHDQRLIPGLRTGIDGMAVNGRRSMLIPPSLGYGDAGWGNGLVGPNDTLRADVSVLWAGRRPSWTWPQLHQVADSGGAALDLVTGSGAPFAAGAAASGTPEAAGATGVVMIDAVDLDGDSTVASMWDGCDAHALDPGSNDLMDWFVDDLDGLRPGGTRLVLQPDGVADDRGADAWVVTLAWTQG